MVRTDNHARTLGRHRRLAYLRVGLAGAVAASLVVTTASSAGATTPGVAGAKPQAAHGGISPADYAKLRAQAPLLEAATKMQETAQREGIDGLVGTSIDGNRLTVFWHGAVPARISSVLAQSGAGSRYDIKSSPYSYKVLDAEAHRLAGLSGVTGSGFLDDFSGLWIGLDPADVGAAATRGLSASALLPASSIKVEPRELSRAKPAARYTDTAPFYGGGAIEHRSGIWPFYSYSWCTTGFAARRTSDLVQVITTAHHCGANQEWHTPEGQKLSLGNSNGGISGIDSMTISGKTYGARVFTGAYNSDTSISVNGWVLTSNNAYVCYSGSWSGAVCDNYIRSQNVYINLDGTTVGPGFWTENASRAGAGEGDSGGPALAGSTGSGLNAIGQIDAINLGSVTTCQGRGEGRQCARWVYSINMAAVLYQQGLALATSL